jgi:di/tricarboxylate transporter
MPSFEIIAFLVLFVVALVLFAFEWVAADVTALGLMLSLILLGLLDANQAFAGFGSETVLMILGLLILTETLVYTGLVDLVGRWLLLLVGNSLKKVQAVILIGPAIMSSFISNTASAAFFLPIALGLSNRSGIRPSKLLMPLAFAAILAGSVTLIGTSTNIVVSGLMVQYGLEPMGMFELTPVGLPILLVGLVYMATIGQRLLPNRHVGDEKEKNGDSIYFTEITVPANSPLVGRSIDDSGLIHNLHLGMLSLQREDEVLKPLADTMLFAADILLVEGSREAMLRLPDAIGIEVSGKIQELEEYMKDGTAITAEVVILPGSPLIGRTIKGLGLRDLYQLQVLAVNQAGEISHSRIGRLTLGLGDVLLIRMPRENLLLLENERMFRILDIIENKPIDYKKVFLSSALFLSAFALAITEILPIGVAVMLGAFFSFLFRLITPDVAYRNIEWKTIILIGSMLAFGKAMQETGTADFLAQWIVQLPFADNPIALLSIFFIVALILTQPMSNQAAAAVLVPIAMQTATLTGFNPRSFAIMIVLAASCSFITPLEPACVLVYGAGRYKFIDFMKVGGLLTIFVYFLAIILVPILWPVQL